MRVLVSTYDFAPQIGGTETACLTLCDGLVSRGHDVTVVTSTPAAPGTKDRYPFEVVRLPSLLEQARLVRAHDVLWQNGLCLRLPGLFTSLTPKVFVHHLPPQHLHIQRLVCRTGTNVLCQPDDAGDGRPAWHRDTQFVRRGYLPPLPRCAARS